MELLGHMVVLKRCLCQQFRDGRSTRQEEGGSDAGGTLQVYTHERCVVTEVVGLGGGDQRYGGLEGRGSSPCKGPAVE